MLACDETVTLIRCDGETYTCTPLEGVSWYDKTVVVREDRGLTFANAVKVRIPAAVLEAAGVTPETGDHIVRGTASGVGTPAQLAALSPRKIMTVGDNRRGRFPHVLLVGN